jgi:hypothetical protein
MNSTNTEHLIEALSSNCRAEMRGYHTYNTLSQQEAETQPRPRTPQSKFPKYCICVQLSKP